MNNEGCAKEHIWLTESYAYLNYINKQRDGDILVLSPSIASTSTDTTLVFTEKLFRSGLMIALANTLPGMLK